MLTMPSRPRHLLLLLLLGVSGCDQLAGLDKADGDSLVKRNRTQLAIGERMPNEVEARVVGAADEPITRDSGGFKALVACEDCPFVFKDEERNHSDRMMTP